MFPRRSLPPVLLSAIGVLAAMSFGPDARAFCREVTVAPPAGYDPVVAGCYLPAINPDTGGGVHALYWRNLCVGYSLQQDASRQVSLFRAKLLAAEAFTNWTTASCAGAGSPSITAINEGPSFCGLVEYNETAGNVHVISFRDNSWPYQDSSNTLGLTTLTVNRLTGEIYDADMEINTHDFTLNPDGMAEAGSSYDLLGVLTHEAGHFLGLAHSDNKNAVMYAHYTPASNPITDDDVAGLCSIYPPSMLRETSSGAVAGAACDATPIGGLSTVCGGGDAGVNREGLTMCPTSSGCSVSRREPTRGSAFGGAVAGLLGLGVLARRRVRDRSQRDRRAFDRPHCDRRARAAVAALGVSLAAVGATSVGMREARASVSIAVLFDELVSSASAAAVVTPTEQRAVWENNRIYTYTHVHVDRLVAGSIDGDVLVKTMGGAVGDIGQIVEGEAIFAVGMPSLVFLRGNVDPATGRPTGDFVVAARAQGQFPVVVGQNEKPHLMRAADVGALLPPSAERIARFVHVHSSASASRFASDVMQGRPVDDAAHEVAAVWAPLHTK